jgi:hypothetical protein
LLTQLAQLSLAALPVREFPECCGDFFAGGVRVRNSVIRQLAKHEVTESWDVR